MDNILDILKTKKVKSTFFLVEPNMREYPQAVLRLIEEGHYPALHSVTHDKRMLYEGNPLNVAEEMRHTQKTLYELTGVTSHLTRAPFWQPSLYERELAPWAGSVHDEDVGLERGYSRLETSRNRSGTDY